MTIVHFRPKKETPTYSKHNIKLLDFADTIDEMIIHAIFQDQLPPQEIAAVLTHRLERFLEAMPSLQNNDIPVEELRKFLMSILAPHQEEPLEKSS